MPKIRGYVAGFASIGSRLRERLRGTARSACKTGRRKVQPVADHRAFRKFALPINIFRSVTRWHRALVWVACGYEGQDQWRRQRQL